MAKLKKKPIRPPVRFKSKGRLGLGEILRHVPSVFASKVKKKGKGFAAAAKRHVKKALTQGRYGLHGGRETEIDRRLRKRRLNR